MHQAIETIILHARAFSRCFLPLPSALMGVLGDIYVFRVVRPYVRLCVRACVCTRVHVRAQAFSEDF